MAITKCEGEGQGSCKRCDQLGIWNRRWMTMLYKVDGVDGCYCYDCARKIHAKLCVENNPPREIIGEMF